MLIEQLLQRREDRNVEFKLDSSSVKRILEDYVAFANTADGWIVIGIEDAGTVVGVEDPQADEEKLSQAVYDSTEPARAPRIVVVTHEGRELVLIEARFVPGPDPVARG